jgi:release factor glutamine methyltransferase
MGKAITFREFRATLIADLEVFMEPGEARSIARIVMDYLDVPENMWLSDPSQIVPGKYQTEVNKITRRLQQDRPIQYVLGETFFCDLKIKVNKNVLIPRPETEEMVYRIIGEYAGKKPIVLDLGTGSGCIAIALARHLDSIRVTGLDVSESALETAKENAALHQVPVRFICDDMLTVGSGTLNEKADLIVSNPPYVMPSDKESMHPRVTNHEPVRALFVPQDDPLVYYRAILRIAEFGLSPGGTIWTEINESLGEETMELFVSSGFKKSILLRDIHEKHRFIKARRI